MYPGSILESAESDSFGMNVSVSAGAFFVSDLSDSGRCVAIATTFDSDCSISFETSSHLDFPFPLFLSLLFPLSEGYGWFLGEGFFPFPLSSVFRSFL